jgi:UPF0288 family protein (methanogenesis marker protein 3)
MRDALKAVLAGGAVALLLSAAARGNEVVCKPQKVKRVSRLCVYLINQASEPVSDANLIVWTEGKEIAEGQTDKDGRFSFSDLKKGSYTVVIRANGYQGEEFRIVIDNPSQKCDRAVQVILYVGGPRCPGMVKLVKPR